ncbi:helix-turn-helix domain-containing protein [Amycolatopsis orientalis]|uniref:helix-turn-helix domain-containing protein n=1 Tax=Amycolatopsis orientalis TaxID=31958 RepID=UPI0009F3A080|nr:helix-turn-helix transcriptional regulator [Amycolatopsis orientalis]
MDDQLARMVGDRVRFHRTAARLTKTVVAGLVGITPDYLYQIERGQKVPTIAVLTQLAHVLRVEPGDLLSGGRPARKRPLSSTATDAIYRAMTTPSQRAAEPSSLSAWQRDVRRAWQVWQSSPHRYSELAQDLPDLVATSEAAIRGTDGATLRQAQAVTADLYGLLRTVTKRLGRVDLSLLAADRAIRAAEHADDPVRQAGARWNLAQVLLADGRAEEAETVAMQAVDDLQDLVRRSQPDAIALSGALLLIAAVAAVRAGQVWTGRDRLRQAAPLAEQEGERNTCWTAFGPTNVAMYAVSLEVESGEAVEGLRLAQNVDHDRSPSIERRVAFLLDQAKHRQAVRVERIEQGIADFYRRFELTAEKAELIRTGVLRKFEGQQADARAGAARAEKRQAQLADERQKLLQAHYAGHIPGDLLGAEMNRLTRALAEAEVELKASRATTTEVEATLSAALVAASHCHRAYLTTEPGIRRQINQGFFAKMYIDHDGCVESVELNEPFTTLLSPVLHRATTTHQTVTATAQTAGDEIEEPTTRVRTYAAFRTVGDTSGEYRDAHHATTERETAPQSVTLFPLLTVCIRPTWWAQ